MAPIPECSLALYKICESTDDNKIYLLQGCDTCGSKGCDRHDPEISAEPWTGLQIHKQLDQAIEDVSY